MEDIVAKTDPREEEYGGLNHRARTALAIGVLALSSFQFGCKRDQDTGNDAGINWSEIDRTINDSDPRSFLAAYTELSPIDAPTLQKLLRRTCVELASSSYIGVFIENEWRAISKDHHEPVKTAILKTQAQLESLATAPSEGELIDSGKGYTVTTPGAAYQQAAAIASLQARIDAYLLHACPQIAEPEVLPETALHGGPAVELGQISSSLSRLLASQPTFSDWEQSFVVQRVALNHNLEDALYVEVNFSGSERLLRISPKESGEDKTHLKITIESGDPINGKSEANLSSDTLTELARAVDQFQTVSLIAQRGEVPPTKALLEDLYILEQRAAQRLFDDFSCDP